MLLITLFFLFIQSAKSLVINMINSFKFDNVINLS
nr:MAG TPA: hypothetical protein [Caudoviricetes sp.]